MPGGDGSGPMDRGAMTGWGRGPCGEQDGPPFARGVGGGGRGWRNRFRATGRPGRMRGAAVPPAFAGAEPTVDTQLEILERRAAALEIEQQEIKTRLGELKAER